MTEHRRSGFMRRRNALSSAVAVAAGMCESPVVGPNGGCASGIRFRRGGVFLLMDRYISGPGT